MLFASTVQVGDCMMLNPVSTTFAVQRSTPNYLGNEGDDEYLGKYPAFRQDYVFPVIKEQVETTIRNPGGCIDVGRLSIHGLSNAASLQIGSNVRVDTRSRTKHIRQLESAGMPEEETMPS